MREHNRDVGVSYTRERNTKNYLLNQRELNLPLGGMKMQLYTNFISQEGISKKFEIPTTEEFEVK